MFDLVHQMRTRVITSPSFTGERIIGAILFEDTFAPATRHCELSVPFACVLLAGHHVVIYHLLAHRSRTLLSRSIGVRSHGPAVRSDSLLERRDSNRRSSFGLLLCEKARKGSD